MSYNDNERKRGNLTHAEDGRFCEWSVSGMICASEFGMPGHAIHVWNGKAYCPFHSPFDDWTDEEPTYEHYKGTAEQLDIVDDLINAHGWSKDKIRAALRAFGWTPAEINAMFRQYQTEYTNH